MQSSIKRILTSILLSLIVISFMAFPVSAGGQETIEFNDVLHAEKICKGYTEYKLIIPQSTVYGIHAQTTTAVYDFDCPYTRITGNNGELVCSEIFDFYSNKTGLGSIVTNIYLEKGEYNFEVLFEDDCMITIDGVDWDVYITKDGQRMDYKMFGSINVEDFFFEEEGHKYELVIEPGKRNQDCQFLLQKAFPSHVIKKLQPLKGTITVPLEMDTSYLVDFFPNDYEMGTGYRFNISSGTRDKFEDGNKNVLADLNEDLSFWFDCEDRSDLLVRTIYGARFPHCRLSIGARIKEPIVFIAETQEGDACATIYCFVKDEASTKEMALNQEYNIAAGKFEIDSLASQVVYSFTPDKDSTYSLTSTGKDANPYVAVFDSDDNCIGWYDNNINATEVGFQEYRLSQIDYQLNMQIDLKAGQTYYFYFTNGFMLSRDTLSFIEYRNTTPYTVKLTDLSESQKPATPTSQTTPTSTPTQPAGQSKGTFEDFVERLYVVALERDSEPEGKAFWCEKVQDGTYDGAYCARFFLTSPEFLGKNKTDGEFVDTLYRTFFDREADDEGRAFWVDKLKTSSRESIVEGFINSTEWCNICASYGVKSGAKWAKATIASANATAFATRLYTECLRRDAETEGLNYWSLSLTNLERTGTQAAKEFFYSEEFLGKNLSNEDYVMRLYKTFMGREPEAEGKAYWLDLLNNGGSRDEVFNFFSSCPEFTEICTKYAIDR